MVFAHLECSISSHSHRAKLILRQFRAAITSKHHQSTTEADRKSTAQIRVTDATTNLVSFSIFIFSCTEENTTISMKVRCSIYPFALCYPHAKFSNHTSSIKDLRFVLTIISVAFGLAFGILAIFAPFTIFRVSRTRILGESVVETYLTRLIPN